MNSTTRIRTASPSDAEQLARVHIQAWQEAYTGIVPQSYLDQLPLKLAERIDMWNLILANPQRWCWVAENPEGLVGFVLFGPPREPNYETYIELGAIYLLAAQHGQKIGYSLLTTGFCKMHELGYKKSYCWAIENNPTIKFYLRTGAKFNSQVKQAEIGGKVLNEQAFAWDSLSKLPIP